MFWCDAGSEPVIETAWLDGSRRLPLVRERIRHPTGLAVDSAADHTLYWADTKLNHIESMRPDGSNRAIILKGDKLGHPLSLDIFENHIFWLTKDKGELVKQDKFGRGIPVILARNLVNPTSVKVYHSNRYNVSLVNPCANNPCSHLCLIVPGGMRCLCPDNARQKVTDSQIICDSAAEEALPLPRVCLCQNGGLCRETDTDALECSCPRGFLGDYCETPADKQSMQLNSVVAILGPLALILVLSAAAAAFYFRNRPFGKGPVLSSLTNSQSVSFRQGTNVEFGTPAFPSNGPNMQDGDSDYGMSDMRRDFTNPMYDALQGQPPPSLGDLPQGGVEASSAVLAPSSIAQVSLGSKKQQKLDLMRFKHKELDPVTVDTGKDTQRLVMEEEDC